MPGSVLTGPIRSARSAVFFRGSSSLAVALRGAGNRRGRCGPRRGDGGRGDRAGAGRPYRAAQQRSAVAPGQEPAAVDRRRAWCREGRRLASGDVDAGLFGEPGPSSLAALSAAREGAHSAPDFSLPGRLVGEGGREGWLDPPPVPIWTLTCRQDLRPTCHPCRGRKLASVLGGCPCTGRGAGDGICRGHESHVVEFWRAPMPSLSKNSTPSTLATPRNFAGNSCSQAR